MVIAARRIEIDLLPKQALFVDMKAPYSGFIGGIGSGKTRAGVVRALLYMGEHAKSLGMVTAPSFPMLRDSTLRTIEQIFPAGDYELHRGEMRLTLANGSEALLRSTDDPDHLRGPNLAWVYMDEAAISSREAFQVLQGSLRQEGFPTQLWLTTTPKGYNWVYTEFVAQERLDYHWIQCSARENTFLPPDFIRRLEEAYSGELALQEIEGQFVLVGGKAFFLGDRLRDMLGDCRDPFEQRYGNLVRIWRPPLVAGRYVAFGDVAWGEKGSYSAVALLDWSTGEQVAEIHGRPAHDELAKCIYDLCTQYNKAYLGIEDNGEGRNVVKKLHDLGYGPRMYCRTPEHNDRLYRSWLTDGISRPVMLGDL